MASFHASSLVYSLVSDISFSDRRKLITRDIIDFRKLRTANLSVNKQRISRRLVPKTSPKCTMTFETLSCVSDQMVMAKMYSIMEVVADRIEMHTNIKEQRSNWNSLLLSSTNAIILGAATLNGVAAATSAVDSALLALKLSAGLMYAAVTGILTITSIFQPSQLAEEQRNAKRLFQKLYMEIKTIIAIGSPTKANVDELIEKVLALDRAFPLPILGVMLDKFPSSMQPAVWWPKKKPKQGNVYGNECFGNGWDEKLEKEMKEIVGILGKTDKADYLRLGEKALVINKVLAVSCPLLTGLAAICSAFVGSRGFIGTLGTVFAVAGGALASLVNTVEHGGQVGMVVELYRGNAGFFKEMEESIESNLKEPVLERRENGELFEMKVALELGRSVSELRDIAAKGQNTKEFGSKLF